MSTGAVLFLTLAIIAIIVATTIYGLISSNARFVNNAPSILTSMGIFGTFLGITIGLASFDPGDIGASVPLLFEGIKLAFWTSVVGILGSLLIKFRLLLYPLAAEAGGGRRVGVEDVVSAVRGVERSLTDAEASPLLGKLAQASEDQSRMAEAMERQAAENQARIDALRESSEAGLRSLAASTGEQMDKLADKLGESQEELMSRLQAAQLDEMRQMRESLSGPGGIAEALKAALGGEFEKLSQSLAASGDTTADRIKNVTDAINAMRDSMGGDSAALIDRLDSLNRGSQALESGLVEAVEKMRQSAANDAVTLADRLDQFNASSGTLNENLGKTLDRLREAMGADAAAMVERLDRLNSGSESLADRVSAALAGLREAMGGDTDALIKQLERIGGGSEAQGERLLQSLDANREALADIMQKNRDAIAAQMAGAMTDLRDALVGPDGVDGAKGSLGERISSALDGLADSMEALGQSLSGSFGEGVEGLSGNLNNFATGIADAIDDLRMALIGPEGAKGEKGSLGDRLSAALDGVNAALAETSDKNRAAMAEQIATAVSDLRDALVGPDAGKDGKASLGERLSAALEGVNASLADSVDKSRDAMTAQMMSDAAAMREAIGGMSEAMTNALGEDMGGLQRRLDGLSDSVQALSETLSGSFGEGVESISGNLKDMAAGIADAIDDLRVALVGPEGSAVGLAEELRAAQKDTGSTLAAIHSALQENTARQIDYSPKPLLDALEQMIKQFNTQFSGQFWEKFDGFNQGIADLIGWMDTYRKQISDLNDQHARTTRNMDLASRRFDEIASRSEIFIDVSRNMSSLLGGLDSQRAQMESHLKQFAHVVDVTRDSLENIEEKIAEGNEKMNDHLRGISQRIEEQVIRLDSALDAELSKAMTSFGQQLAALSEKFVDDYGPLTEKLRDVVSIARRV